MKKIFLIIVVLYSISLKSCSKSNYDIVFNYNYDESNLYFPTPIKSNSVFIGFQIVGDEENIYEEISFSLLKKAINYKLDLIAIYQELNESELFTFIMSEENNYYLIEKNILTKYPREITFPNEHNGLCIKEINDFGFYGITGLVKVNLGENIENIRRHAFANTNLYWLNKKINADSSAFSNTLLDRQLVDKRLTLLEGNITKEVVLFNKKYTLNINLNGGKIIKEELDLYITIPILENKIFENYENEIGYKLTIPEDKLFFDISLREYYRNILGLTYKVNATDLTNDYFIFEYISDTDSYALSFDDENLKITKLKFPSYFNNKPITEINIVNNKYVFEIELGKHVKKINNKFNTPNLKKIKFNSELDYIIVDAFENTLFYAFT